ncbi:cell division protein FtsL [Paenibacillus marinisediminis]
MAYVRGNLAVQPKRQPQREERYRETAKTVVRKSNLSGREKVLYLMTIIFCVAIAIVLIGRYTEIYNTNRNIQQVMRDTEALKKEAGVLEATKEKKLDWDRIADIAAQNGLVYSEDLNDIKVQQDSGN